MKIVVAPDSFKENLPARAVARALARGIRDVLADAEVVEVPMADGGEGTVEALVDATDGRFVEREVTDPLGDKVTARFGILGDGETAVIEMAAASGLPLVPPEKRNPLVTSTFGTGELIAAALDEGVRKIILGIGGSATVDGGTGMARALGVRFLDEDDRDVPQGGGALMMLALIDMSGRDERIASVSIDVACDVDNPLTGAHGAAHVYGPQKGATPEQVKTLDNALAHLGEVIRRDLEVDVGPLPGSGAAGGLGAGLVAFLGAQLRPGIDIVVEAVQLREKVKGADLVLTGEGRMDRQSAFGKTPVGVALAAQAVNVPVVAVVGSIGDGAEALLDHGVSAFFAIPDRPMTLDESCAQVERLLRQAAANVVRTFLAGRSG